MWYSLTATLWNLIIFTNILLCNLKITLLCDFSTSSFCFCNGKKTTHSTHLQFINEFFTKNPTCLFLNDFLNKIYIISFTSCLPIQCFTWKLGRSGHDICYGSDNMYSTGSGKNDIKLDRICNPGCGNIASPTKIVLNNCEVSLLRQNVLLTFRKYALLTSINSHY